MKDEITAIIAGTMLAVMSITSPASASAMASGYGSFSYMDSPSAIANLAQSRTKNLLIKQPIQIAQLTIDASGIPESYAKGIIGLLGYLSIQPTGTVKEDSNVWCVFNDHRARDQRAGIEGTYDGGRFSIGTTFGGRWYCAKKRG